jgi:hypothetical protein
MSIVARIDDYKESFRLAAIELKESDRHRLAAAVGAEWSSHEDGREELRLSFLGTSYTVQIAETVDVLREGEKGEVPLPEKILICHYLLRASGEPVSGELITFRQVPDGQFYFDAFQRRSRDPLLATFGKDHDLFRKCAAVLGGQPVDNGDTGMVFQVLPGIPVHLILWRGDEEFPPEASILFDSSIQRRLSAEDIAVLSGMLVYRLMGLARSHK